MKRNVLHEIMTLAWQFVKRNGYTMSEALKVAWTNMKLMKQMKERIVKFYFQKVDGSVREAYGTLKNGLVPETGNSDRVKNDTVQFSYDTYHQIWQSFNKANLIMIA